MNKIQKPIKIILLVVLLIGGLGISIFAGTKVSSMFLNSAKAEQCLESSSSVLALPPPSVTANSAIITWKTTSDTTGKVIYGTDSKSLTLSAIEQSGAKVHSMPLTVLTPSTTYFYMIQIGDKTCDSSGLTCDNTKGDCVPARFSTTAVSASGEIVAPIESVTPYVTAIPTTSSVSATIRPNASPSPVISKGPSPTSGLSAFCQEVEKNVGQTDDVAATWTNVKKYDLDDNGIINGKDIIKCPSTGN
jgi:hypothetical protein